MLTSRSKRSGKSVNPLPPLAVVSLGTANTICVIARRDPGSPSGLEVLGVGRASTTGLAAGLPVDLAGAQLSVRIATERAEQQAGVAIDSVSLVVSGGGLSSRILQAGIPVNGKVTEEHVRQVNVTVRAGLTDTNRSVIYAAPLNYSVDRGAPIYDPRDMFAQDLSLRMTAVMGHTPSLKNLAQVVMQAGLKLDAVIASPLAAAQGVLVQEEARSGAMVIDMGAGSTGLAILSEGGLVHLETLPLGSRLVTSDLARGLHTAESAAERIKVNEADLLLDTATLEQKIVVPCYGSDGKLAASECTRGQLASFCGPRLEEIFQMAARRVKASGQVRGAPARIVLTGGGSHLRGVRELAEDVFGAPVRLAMDTLLPGLCKPEEIGLFAATAGALRLRASGLIAANPQGAGLGEASQGIAQRAGTRKAGLGLPKAISWLRENF